MDSCQKTADLKAGGLLIINFEEMEEGGVFQNLKVLTDLRKHFQRLPVALPGTVRAIHIICLPKQTFAMNLSMAFLRGILQTLNPLLRVRVQFHKGWYKKDCERFCIDSANKKPELFLIYCLALLPYRFF